MRLYQADLSAPFHDVRGAGWEHVHDPDDHAPGQRLGRELFDAGSNGIAYRSVRHAGGECLVSFRPKLVTAVKAAGHFEYRWSGRPEPAVRQIDSPPGL